MTVAERTDPARTDWNEAVLAHPELEIADKLIYHLLVRSGSDDLAVRRQIAGLLQRSERHIRRVCARLRQYGFAVSDAPTLADLQVRRNGHPCPVRTPLSAVPVTPVRNGSYPPSARTPMSEARTPRSETDLQVRRNGHPCPVRTPMSAPPTRARTCQSSSYEEDSICTAVPPLPSLLSSPPPGEGKGEGGVGGEQPREGEGEGTAPFRGEEEPAGEEPERTAAPAGGEEPAGAAPKRPLPPRVYLSQMQSWWDAIWPDNREEELPWFGQLWAEFGEQIPVQVLRQFAEGGRTLTDLDYPERFQNYFRVCCRNAQPGSSLSPDQPSSPGLSPSVVGSAPRGRSDGPGPPAGRASPERRRAIPPAAPLAAPAHLHPMPAEGHGSPPEGHGRRPSGAPPGATAAPGRPSPVAYVAPRPGRAG
jgi:hypothetical protein